MIAQNDRLLEAHQITSELSWYTFCDQGNLLNGVPQILDLAHTNIPVLVNTMVYTLRLYTYYIFVFMFRIDRANCMVPKAELRHTGVTLGTLQRVLVSRPKFQLLAEL